MLNELLNSLWSLEVSFQTHVALIESLQRAALHALLLLCVFIILSLPNVPPSLSRSLRLGGFRSTSGQRHPD